MTNLGHDVSTPKKRSKVIEPTNPITSDFSVNTSVTRSEDDYWAISPMNDTVAILVHRVCLYLLNTNVIAMNSPPLLLPESIQEPRVGNDLSKLRSIFEKHGFRTSAITSPRSALSIYKDSCSLFDNECHRGARAGEENDNSSCSFGQGNGKEFLISMLGLHPHHFKIERCYATSIKPLYCLARFCDRMKEACPSSTFADDKSAKAHLIRCEKICHIMVVPATSSSSSLNSSSSTAKVSMNRVIISAEITKQLNYLMTAIVQSSSGRIRMEQLEKEYEHIKIINSTFTNAILQLFVRHHRTIIKDVYFKHYNNHKEDRRYERFVVYLYDANVDLIQPQSFTYLPSLRKAIDEGVQAIVNDMVKKFWSHLLRLGYFATTILKKELSPELTVFFLNGLTTDVELPLQLNARFQPHCSLSIYLHGKAGAGKSSLVRNVAPALNRTIEQHVDPEILVRYVKQNLNKSHELLDLEFQLRPNNNDLSVMSIIEGRKRTLSQSKPGLVVINLEEMARDSVSADPNQLMTCQLISQRFVGRRGVFRERELNAPRNSKSRGMSHDASVISFFSSNYPLRDVSLNALRRLEMFKNLRQLSVSAIDGIDRSKFTNTYIRQYVRDVFHEKSPRVHVEIDELVFPLRLGDTRNLVLQLRMIAYHICSVTRECKGELEVGTLIRAKVEAVAGNYRVVVDDASVVLTLGIFGNMYLVPAQPLDPRSLCASQMMRQLGAKICFDELSQILDYFFAGIIAPGVIISRDHKIISDLVSTLGLQEGVRCITGINPKEYKMMRSLCDEQGTHNLRDDIINLGGGKGAFIVVEITCLDLDAQHIIREITEDTPSMTAFSTEKSALLKNGIFFAVHIQEEISSQIRSRASLVL